MDKQTDQIKHWTSEAAKEYCLRNSRTLEEGDNLFKSRFGITRTQANAEFLSSIDKNIKILEVGCNRGDQLVRLLNMGFNNLFGLEISGHPFEVGKRRPETSSISFIKGSALDLPFKDKYFDLVFTSGVLIHISPEDIGQAITEICRCSSQFIWGYECFSDEYEEIEYRGKPNLQWHANFAKAYMEICPDLTLVKEKLFKRSGEEHLIDQMFLLKKQG